MALKRVIFVFVSAVMIFREAALETDDLKKIDFNYLSNLVPTSIKKMPCPLLLIAKQYTEMPCKVVSKRNATFLNCPKEYDCSAADQLPEDSCRFKGKTYEVGSKIPKKLMDVRCKSNCVCKLNDEGVAAFVCDTEECPAPTPGCRQIYSSHSKCCPTEKCKATTKKSKNCKYMDKWFSYGEIIFNNFENTRCMCQKGFDGTMKGKWCQKAFCGIELDYQNTIKMGCSPVYDVNITGVNEILDKMKNVWSVETILPVQIITSVMEKMTSQISNICPMSWICPSENDVLIPALSLMADFPDIDPTTTCTFGYNDMALLDILMTPENEDGSCAVCTCLMPPMLSCVHKIPCWTF